MPAVDPSRPPPPTTSHVTPAPISAAGSGLPLSVSRILEPTSLNASAAPEPPGDHRSFPNRVVARDHTVGPAEALLRVPGGVRTPLPRPRRVPSRAVPIRGGPGADLRA